MTAISNTFSAPPIQLPVTRQPEGLSEGAGLLGTKAEHGSPEQLHQKFTQFVGEAFFGQMIKAMRTTVGKPAYFDGGRAEEAFRGQLDQKLAEEMTKSSADKFAEPMFRQQFPNVELPTKPQASQRSASDLSQLLTLSRR
jgi:Rod binding domain-containing protein